MSCTPALPSGVLPVLLYGIVHRPVTISAVLLPLAVTSVMRPGPRIDTQNSLPFSLAFFAEVNPAMLQLTVALIAPSIDAIAGEQMLPAHLLDVPKRM